MSGKRSGASLGLYSRGASRAAKVAPAAASLAVREVDLRTSIRPTVAEVDLGALKRNLARVRRMLGPRVAVYGVVKADAYGHGAVAVSKVLAPLCDALAVSLVEEGLELRGAGITSPVIVLGGYYERCRSEVLEEGLTPVVYDRGDLERFGTAPARRRPGSRSVRDSARPSREDAPDERVGVHVKVDTGMNRLGVPATELPGLFDHAGKFPRVRIEGLCTHFASADVVVEASAREQLRTFEEGLALARARAPRLVTVHAANSAAALRFPEARFDAVRPGIALYGAMPSPVVAWSDLEAVLTLRTKVMAIHQVPPGAHVSYGGLWRAQRLSRIATLPIGYADGYPRHVQGASALIRGWRAPVVGAVCMDMLMIDITDVSGAGLGDDVTLIGAEARAGRNERITVDDVAGWAGTVNYEILCGISKRVPRIYR